MKWCKHFNGTTHQQCNAGVPYDSVRADIPIDAIRLPCFRESVGVVDTCSHREFKTDAEAKADYEAGRMKVNAALASLSLPPNVWHPDGDRPLCTGGHRGKMVMHLDGTKEFTNVYRCADCGGTMVSTQKRRGMDRAMWEEDEGESNQRKGETRG